MNRLAFIAETSCIGCTKCLDVCPTDAIIGADRLMHTVVTAECIGCKLCIPACPVDCIELVEAPSDFTMLPAEEIKARNQRRKKRLNETDVALDDNENSLQQRKRYILEALSRVRGKK